MIPFIHKFIEQAKLQREKDQRLGLEWKQGLTAKGHKGIYFGD